MELTTFKASLHQSLQALHGQVYSGLAVDVLHFAHCPSTSPSVQCILRVMANDLEMILGALACMNALQGHRCLLQTTTSPPPLWSSNRSPTSWPCMHSRIIWWRGGSDWLATPRGDTPVKLVSPQTVASSVQEMGGAKWSSGIGRVGRLPGGSMPIPKCRSV